MVSDIEELHRGACARGDAFYLDPSTGLHVFTAARLSARPCCGCGCRHCPYRPAKRLPSHPRPLVGDMDDLPESVDVLFWSGGKDSFLALRRLQKEALRPVVLLTTFDATTRVVAHQEVNIRDVERQARALKLVLMGVPVAYGEYLDCVRRGLNKLRDNGIEIARVAFGDLHLEHIRAWREGHLKGLGAQLIYPLWRVSYAQLHADLENADVVVRLSAVDKEKVRGKVEVGDVFDRQMVKRLPNDVDDFGENGEFHTLVEVWNKPLSVRDDL